MTTNVVNDTPNHFTAITDITMSTDATSVLNNLVHDKITRVSWCILYEFSIPLSTQTTSSINFNVGAATTFAI